MRFFIVLTLSLLSLTLSTTAFGHKVRIFAYGDGEMIVGETAFSGGKKPKNVEISVLGKNTEKVLATTTTDELGKFKVPIPEEAKSEKLDLRIVVNVGEGHRGEWLLEASEYLPNITQNHSDSHKNSVEAKSPAPESTPPQNKITIDPDQLQLLVEKAVEKQLGPVKQMLAANREKQVSLQDILGGIGYLLGLAGIAAYIQSKKEKKQ